MRGDLPLSRMDTGARFWHTALMSIWGEILAAPGVVIRVAVDQEQIVRLALGSRQREFLEELARKHPERVWKRDDLDPLIVETRRQLEAYFRGELREFQLPLQLQGTPFQKRVWAALLRIPYGSTRSYGEIARAIRSPKAARAVGLANHDNPVGIIVPCHRVIASDGSLGGYACGLEFKRRLLDLESKAAAPSS